MNKCFSYVLALYYKLKGVRLEKHLNISCNVSLLRGVRNSRPGEIIINSDCQLSRGVVLNAFGGKIHLQHNTFLGEYVIIYGHGGVIIGNNCLIAAHSCIVSSNHTIPSQKVLIRSQPDILLPVTIGNDVWVGAGAKILGGVELGDGCVIGAGAVVSRSLPAYAIAVGVPAKIIGFRNV